MENGTLVPVSSTSFHRPYDEEHTTPSPPARPRAVGKHEHFLASTTTTSNRLQGRSPVHRARPPLAPLFHDRAANPARKQHLARDLADSELHLATVARARRAGQPAHPGRARPDDVHLRKADPGARRGVRGPLGEDARGDCGARFGEDGPDDGACAVERGEEGPPAADFAARGAAQGARGGNRRCARDSSAVWLY